MEFEFDRNKSDSNKYKHGIDFIKTQALWNDPDLVEIPAKVGGEPRFLVIGRIDGKYWSGIITYRNDRIRLIAVRRARPEEIEIYEGA